MWAERLQLLQLANDAPTDLHLHYMSSLGYVYKADYLGYQGYSSEISADAVGNVKRDPDGPPDCSESAYQSFSSGDGARPSPTTIS